MNRKIVIIVVCIIPLVVLGGWNIAQRIKWKEPSDGVIWAKQAKGLTAIKVQLDSQAYLSGIRKGDILYSINNIKIRNKIDLAKVQWSAWHSNQRLTYEISRREELYHPFLFLETRGTNLLYFYLALIGLTSLVISLFVFFNAKKSFTLPYLFFFFISMTFYSLNIFSPTGHLDLLDSIFYWLDKLAFLTFPPLLFHFFLLFPKRRRIPKEKIASLNILYLPASILFLGVVFIHLPNIFKFSESFIIHYYRLSEQFELFHFGIFSVLTFGLLLYDGIRLRNKILKKQINLINFGIGLGLLPFTALYIFPFITGRAPSTGGQLSVILLGIIPLIFAYSISRYRMIGLEAILKKAVPFVTSYVVISIFYIIVSSQTKIFSENTLNMIILGILAIILGATLFTPLKKLIQSIIDRFTYRRSYRYRRTLLSISKEASRERNLQKLSQNILVLTANALSLKYISLLLSVEDEPGAFLIFKSRGERPSGRAKLTLDDSLYALLKTQDFLSPYTLTKKRTLQKKFKELSNYGLFHLLPLKVEDRIIGCLGMGKKTDNTLLSSEDTELLLTISSPIALALENAYLFDQAKIRTIELEQLKDYSENIIESLTVGVAVLDQKGQIIGWNRVLEDMFGLAKKAVLEKNLGVVLGKNNFSAIFPSDTQKDFRLMSEIAIEMPDKTKKIFDIAKTPLLDNTRKPYGTIIVFEDITDRITLQQQLLTSEKLASIGLLSAGVAHEINTPLTGISSYVQILQKKMADSPNRRILEKIEAQTDRVGRIVNNLLNFARNPSESSFRRIDLRDSLKEIVALIDYKLRNMNIKLDMQLNTLPLVYAQGEKLQQVFINIILNALDAMPSGGTLKIDLDQEDNQAIIRIRDTGTGIKEQHVLHIFDPFFTTKGIGKGTGLGLSISYAIIQEHKGQINVESEEGKGSLFTISIPIDPGSSKEISHTS